MKYTVKLEHKPQASDDQILQNGIVTSNTKVLGESPDHFSVFIRDEKGMIQGGASVWVLI